MIRTKALTKVFATHDGSSLTAVNQLDLTVTAGEIFGLLGPNGAGKTTTVGMLTTRVVPTSGAAWVGDIDVIRHPTQAKQLIGVTSQVSTLDRSLTVYENLYFHGLYFGMGARTSRQVTDELLERFRLTQKAKADTIALSGGMAQRLMVARAVMHRPSVLFLDEPTAGLDPQSRLALWEVIGELHDAGQTILLTTHYMEEAEQLCERIAIMDHGRILALGTAAELKREVEAETEVCIQAEGDLDAFREAIEKIDGIVAVTVTDGVVRVQMFRARGTLREMIECADSLHIDVRDVAVTEPTLESVFISLTGKELRE